MRVSFKSPIATTPILALSLMLVGLALLIAWLTPSQPGALPWHDLVTGFVLATVLFITLSYSRTPRIDRIVNPASRTVARLSATHTGGAHVALQKVTVCFTDIRGFTALSEKRAPEEVVAMLNEYFSCMVGVIHDHAGIVDKFVGDAIMAVWGAPASTEDDPVRAIHACLAMRGALAALNERRTARGEAPLLIGMGLHLGEAIVGAIGARERMENTVIGDTVNMASRIEAATKAFGTDLLVSESLIAEVKDKFVIAEAGSATVKGKAEPIRLFKVMGYIDEKGSQVLVKTPYSSYVAEVSDKVTAS